MIWFNQYQQKIKSFKQENIEKIVVDEIFTYVKNKNLKGFEKSRKKNWTYLFTAIIKLKNGKTFPFFEFVKQRTEENLIQFLEKLPYSLKYYADEARIYRECWFKSFIVGKNKHTNLVESFNSYLRSKNACLRRRSNTYSKNLTNFSLRLIINLQNFLGSTT